MTLNLISNRAAAVANRQLGITTREVTDSARKLSSGSRVDSARDDAAAMAIGSRLNSELVALKQVQLNATQASSLLQIAEGAVSRVQDTLVRLKALATQAGSGNLSNVERELLDVEFQQLTAEVTRLTADTKFNNNTLVNAAQDVTIPTGAGSLPANGIIEVAANGITPLATYAVDYDATGGSSEHLFTIEETVSGDIWTGQIEPGIMDSSTPPVPLTGGAVRLTPAAANGTYTTGEFFITFGGPNDTVAFDGTDIAAAAATTLTVAGSSTTSQTFKVGTGAVIAEDQISLSMQGVTTDALGLTGSSIATTGFADSANAMIDLALETVIEARSNVGSTMNRVEATADTIAVTVENIDAARSSYLDLNVAEEISSFTAKQVLQQAGVSIAAQANQLPQNLLQLFQ